MVKGILLGAMAAFLITACASFTWRYYGLSLVSYEQGQLLGPEAKDDLPVSVCKPDEVEKGKCVVMLSRDFFAFKQDYEETKQRLKECQAR